MMIHTEDHAGCVARTHHGPGIRQTQCHGLLAEHVLAGGGRAERMWVVEPVDRAHVDGVNVVARHQYADLGGEVWDLVQLRVLGGALVATAGHSRYLVPKASHRGDYADRRDVTGANQAPP
jgi:hypothetical protein